MRFSLQAHRRTEEPDINLIPMIDLFLVIIIFLMQTTTYDRFSELQITLPQGGQIVDGATSAKSREIYVGVQSTGVYKVDGDRLEAGASVEHLVQSLKEAMARRRGLADAPLVVISADAQATHQSVISVMEAANKAGISNVTFATQQPTPSATTGK